jgi:hypothetical protein
MDTFHRGAQPLRTVTVTVTALLVCPPAGRRQRQPVVAGRERAARAVTVAAALSVNRSGAPPLTRRL